MQILDATGQWQRVNLGHSFGDVSFVINGLTDADPNSYGLGVELVPGPDGVRRRVGFGRIYRANPWLFACVNLLARSMSRFPMKVYRDTDDDPHVRIRPRGAGRAASLARALRRPGDGRSQKTLWHATTVDRLVNGNAVWFPERSGQGDYLGFKRIPWKYCEHEEIAGELRYWDTRKPKAKRLADDVVHFGAGLDCDELDNPSSIESMRRTLTLYDAVERHLVAFFKNSARPSGQLEVDKTIASDQVVRNAIRDELTKLYTAPENAGKVMITPGKFTPITATPDSAKVIELAKQSREEICAGLGVPPPLVGILDRAIMANVRELRSHLARDVVGPHAGLFEGDLDAQVIARDSALTDVFAEFEMAAMLRPDLEARAGTFKDRRYVETLNEIRGTETLPRIDHPDADLPWMPLNEAPLGKTPALEDDDDREDDETDPEENRNDD